MTGNFAKDPGGQTDGLYNRPWNDDRKGSDLLGKKEPRTSANKEGSEKRDARLDALQAIGERELSLLRTIDEIKLCTLTAISRMYYNSDYTARDHVQRLTNFNLLDRVPVDTYLVRQSIGYAADVKNPVINLGSKGTSFLGRYLDRGGMRAQKSTFSPTLSWSHDVAVSEALSYIVAMARGSYEFPSDAAPYRAAVRLYGERHSAVWKDPEFTLARRAGYGMAGVSSRIRTKTVIRPDASILWHIRPGSIKSPYAAESNAVADPRWTPTRHSWAAAIYHDAPSLKNIAAAEQDGDGSYRWWLIEMETGSNGAAVIRDKITKYHYLRGLPTRQQLYGRACPQILIVVRSNSQLKRQVELWRHYCRAVTPGLVLVTSLEGLYTVCQAGRAALLTRRCFADPLLPSGSRMLSFAQVLGLSIAITD
ncbi:MAG: hypothetical protein ABI670_08935 [Chloroflexota bacterium]